MIDLDPSMVGLNTESLLAPPPEGVTYRLAPPGFTPEEREFFDREGYLNLPQRLTDDTQVAQDAKP
jgi:hypothetical protein